MQQNKQTGSVFILGSFLMIALMGYAAWVLFNENSNLRNRLDNPTETLEIASEENFDTPNKSAMMLDFQLEMMSLKYPQFSKVVKIVYNKSQEYGVDPKLIMSIIETESAFNPLAVSSAGAYGLMQVNYSVWKDELSINHQKIFDVGYNIELGIKIFKHYLTVANNDALKALHYYNNGYTLQNHSYVSKVTSTIFY